MNSNFKTRSQNCERGSALLIVFVFAAFVAIMLYREMPVAAFEAQRQKEQTLIDRGQQYKRAVKLFYKKFGMYPANMEQLEDTNRMRFLRHRFKDPFTGKDDWRLLHMGPGNMLVDSKVNPLKTNNQGQNALGFGSTSGFGSTANAASNSGFGANTTQAPKGPASSFNSTSSSSFGSNTSSFGSSTSSFGSNTSNSATSSFGSGFSQPGSSWANSGGDPNAVVVAPLTRRRAAMALNRVPRPANPADPSQPDQTDPSQSGDAAEPGQTADTGQSYQGSQGQPSQPGQPAQPNQPGTNQFAINQPGAIQPGAIQPGQLQTPDNQTQYSSNDQSNPDQPVAAAGAQGQNSMGAIRRMLTNPATQPQASSGSSSFTVTSGGLAGVASKAQGHTIKVVNDQLDYSLWEFYYDPNKDTKQVMGIGTNPNARVTPTPLAPRNAAQQGVGAANQQVNAPSNDSNAAPADVPTTTDNGTTPDEPAPEPEPEPPL